MTESQRAADVRNLAYSLGPLPGAAEHPFLIVISGLPGTGKSSVARRLAERLPAVILESDALRHVLFPYPTYSSPESARLFAAIHHLLEELLRRGTPVILDATNLVEHHRDYLYRIAERAGAGLILVRVKAPARLVRQRLEARVTAGGGDSSEADWAVYRHLKEEEEPILRRHYVVDTSRDIQDVLEKIIQEVKAQSSKVKAIT